MSHIFEVVNYSINLRKLLYAGLKLFSLLNFWEQ